MSPRILLMRHGEIPQNTPRRFVGRQNLPLTETGKAQAAAVGKALRRVELERIVCSDLDRTMETAAIVAAHGEFSGLRLEPDARLREITLGQWEGLTKAEVEAAFPDAYEARGKDLAHVRPADGECFWDVQQRAMPCFDQVFAQTQGTALIVAHAGVNRTILCRLLGMDLKHLFRVGQDYCCLNSIVRTGRDCCVDVMNLRLWRELS